MGTLSAFDRTIFKRHLTGLFPDGDFARFLARQGVLIENFGQYVKRSTQTPEAQVKVLTKEADRPFIHLQSATTKASGQFNECLARDIANRDGITECLVCVFSVLETCTSFDVRGNHHTRKLEVVHRRRKCLHFYFYYMDGEFGLMHIRLQSWFPFEIQIYINGQAWLARQLDQRGIAYERYQTKVIPLTDLAIAQDMEDQFAHRQWPRVLDAFARRANSHLSTLGQAGFGGYYWVTDQAEYTTDVFFPNHATLDPLFPSLVELSMTAFGTEDVMRFLERKLHGHFQGDVITDRKRRPEGGRVTHRMKSNSLEMYNSRNVLRLETTINNPRGFRVLQIIRTRAGTSQRRMPTGKGVANLWRYAHISLQPNNRYLNALAHAQPIGKAIAELDILCHPHTQKRESYSGFNPVACEDDELFAAIMAGEHTLNGFRNRDLQTHLYSSPPTCEVEQRQRSIRVTLLISKLCGHSLIAKVKDSRVYHVAARRTRFMSAAIHCRNKDFPRFALAPA